MTGVVERYKQGRQQDARLTPIAAELEFVASVLKEQRFDGMDQNPKGIRDLLTSLVYKVAKMERDHAKQSFEEGWAATARQQERSGGTM